MGERVDASPIRRQNQCRHGVRRRGPTQALAALRRPANIAQSDLRTQHAQHRLGLGEALLGVQLLGVAEREHKHRTLADGAHRDEGL